MAEIFGGLDRSYNLIKSPLAFGAQPVTPVATPTPTAQPPADLFTQFMQNFIKQQGQTSTAPAQSQGQIDYGALLQMLLKGKADAVSGRHLGIGGAEITADNPSGQPGGSPFTNGFFKNVGPVFTPSATAPVKTAYTLPPLSVTSFVRRPIGF